MNDHQLLLSDRTRRGDSKLLYLIVTRSLHAGGVLLLIGIGLGLLVALFLGRSVGLRLLIGGRLVGLVLLLLPGCFGLVVVLTGHRVGFFLALECIAALSLRQVVRLFIEPLLFLLPGQFRLRRR